MHGAVKLPMTENQTERAHSRADVLEELASLLKAWAADGRSLDVAGFDELLEREVKNRSEEEALELDITEWTIDNYRYDPDIMVKWLAESLSRNLSEEGETLVAGSEVHQFTWKLCQALVGMSRESEDLDGSPLFDWALDVAQGLRSAPTRPGGDPFRNIVRDNVIAMGVDRIRSIGLRPATSSNLDGSAAHLVADRLGYSYDTVRRIWRLYKHQFPGTSTMP